MKSQYSRRKAMIIILMGLLAIVVAVFGPAATKDYKSPDYQFQLQAPNQVRDWKSFLDAKYGISFRYPPTWVVESFGAKAIKDESGVDALLTVVINDGPVHLLESKPPQPNPWRIKVAIGPNRNNTRSLDWPTQRWGQFSGKTNVYLEDVFGCNGGCQRFNSSAMIYHASNEPTHDLTVFVRGHPLQDKEIATVLSTLEVDLM